MPQRPLFNSCTQDILGTLLAKGRQTILPPSADELSAEISPRIVSDVENDGA